jgi:uncharacterized OsmC-like protein
VVRALEPGAGRRCRTTGPGFAIDGDNHVDHGGSGAGPDGFDLLAVALGQCLLTTLLAQAERDGIALRSAEAVVSTKARLQGRDAAPYLSDFRVDLYVEGDLDEAARARLERASASLCGVRETLRRAARIEEVLHLGAAPASAVPGA